MFKGFEFIKDQKGIIFQVDKSLKINIIWVYYPLSVK